MNQTNLAASVYSQAAFRNGKFLFPDSVNYVRIDIGLSTHGSHSAWFLDLYRDRGSIGIEPDPRCCEELINGSDLYPEVKRVVIDKQVIRHNNVDICGLGSRFVLVNCAISDVVMPSSLPFYLTDPQLAGSKNQYKVFGTSSLHKPTDAHPAGGYVVRDVLASTAEGHHYGCSGEV